MASRHSVMLPIAYRCRLLLAISWMILSLLPAFSQHLPADRRNARSAASTHPAASPGKVNSAANVRSDQLAKVTELISDADPNARLANLEAVLDTHDRSMIQKALRLAFQSDDANLRSLAMRAYIAGLEDLTLDVVLPPQVKHQYDMAQNDPDAMEALRRQYHDLGQFDKRWFKLHLVFARHTRDSTTGIVSDWHKGLEPGYFRISGDRLTASLMLDLSYRWPCNLELRPTTDLILRGTLRCLTHGEPTFPRMELSAPILNVAGAPPPSTGRR